jgi:hypothetical protein
MILRKPKRDTRILFLYLFALSLELFILFIVVLSMALIEDDIQKTREREQKKNNNQLSYVCYRSIKLTLYVSFCLLTYLTWLSRIRL